LKARYQPNGISPDKELYKLWEIFESFIRYENDTKTGETLVQLALHYNLKKKNQQIYILCLYLF